MVAQLCVIAANRPPRGSVYLQDETIKDGTTVYTRNSGEGSQ